MRDVITLSKKELDRVTVLQQCLQGHLTRVQAAKRLELSYRHTKRLTNALRHGGREALVSKRRGKPGNNRIHQDVRQRGVQLIRDRYSDFGPTLAREKLAELHHIKISRETLRKWMMD
ncbi:MAG: helix-turn-helix domain-containing protein, partial [Myxococcota bacterium]